MLQIDNELSKEHSYIYVFVRTDLPLEQQVVQAIHAGTEAGHSFDRVSVEASSLILLQVPNKEKLEVALARTIERGVRCEAFNEPDWDYGLTAFATEPIFGDRRKVFNKYKLWKAVQNATS